MAQGSLDGVTADMIREHRRSSVFDATVRPEHITMDFKFPAGMFGVDLASEPDRTAVTHFEWRDALRWMIVWPRQRRSRGWRKHVRRTKQLQRRTGR